MSVGLDLTVSFHSAADWLGMPYRSPPVDGFGPTAGCTSSVVPTEKSNLMLIRFSRDVISARGCLDRGIGYPVKHMACKFGILRMDIESAYPAPSCVSE